MADDAHTELARVLAERLPVTGAEREFTYHLSRKKSGSGRSQKTAGMSQGAADSHNDDHRKALIEILAGSGARQWPT
jgi:hypothetical protein